jgi:hypothetical protein
MNCGHRQICARPGIFVDEKIVTLLQLCWSHGWSTNASCQANEPSHVFTRAYAGPYVWICFDEMADALDFILTCYSALGSKWNLLPNTGPDGTAGSVRFMISELAKVEAQLQEAKTTKLRLVQQVDQLVA